MIVRHAHFVGRITGSDPRDFYAFVRERLVPMWQRFPRLEGLEVYYPQSADSGATPIALSLAMYFANADALEEMLASDMRAESRLVTAELLERFDGRVEHHVMAIEAAGPVSASL